MDNLPIGAKDDPRAPYNEEDKIEVDVLASVIISKSIKVLVSKDYNKFDLIDAFLKEHNYDLNNLGKDWIEDSFELIEE